MSNEKEPRETENILFFDNLKAHARYIKKMFEIKGEHDFVIHNIYKLEDVDKYITSFGVTTTVMFIYNREGLYQLLPFLNKEINLVLYTDANEIEWLNYYLPDIAIFDIETPKVELFSQIELEIFKLRRTYTSSDILALQHVDK